MCVCFDLLHLSSVKAASKKVNSPHKTRHVHPVFCVRCLARLSIYRTDLSIIGIIWKNASQHNNRTKVTAQTYLVVLT